MSNAVSALAGGEAQGFATVKELGLQGMVTLKADLHPTVTAKAVKAAIGLDLPEVRHIVVAEGGRAVAWMAPDEVLILCEHGQADDLVATLGKKLATAHHLVVNVSDARAIFGVEGPDVREVLGKLCPADLTDMAPGEVRRSRLAQVPAAFWLDGQGAARVICFRSVAQYVFDLLRTAAKDGSQVGFH